jgi:hypothetical protein
MHLVGVLPQFHVSTASPYHIKQWFRRASELPAEAAYASSVKSLKQQPRLALWEAVVEKVCGCDGESLCMVGPKIKVLLY